MTATDKALERFNQLRGERFDLLEPLFDAKAHLEYTAKLCVQLEAWQEAGVAIGDALEVADRAVFQADLALDEAIRALIDRDAAVWEAHADLHREHDAEQTRKPSRLELQSHLRVVRSTKETE